MDTETATLFFALLAVSGFALILTLLVIADPRPADPPTSPQEPA